jgi:hypothetical protein
MKYIFLKNDIIHSIDFKKSQNSKIGDGNVIQTYHFSIDQVMNNDFTQDKSNCLNCRFSFNQNEGRSGGCYTHKGLQLMGLKSKLRSLHKAFNDGKIKEFDKSEFDNFIQKISTKKVDLCRFGAYGEPSLLSVDICAKLKKLAKNTTGYTHQWHNINEDYSNYFMASIDNTFELAIAKSKGYRSFFATDNKPVNSKTITNCPASKEAGNKTTCVKCSLCNGAQGNSKKDIYILTH